MNKKSTKFERVFSETELKALLDALQTVLGTDAKEMLAPEAFRKFKLSIKQEYGQAYAKLKIDLPSPKLDAKSCEGNNCIAPGEELLKYSKLKKRMKKSFKAITTNLAQDQLPPKEAVDSFLADSEMMVCYPGYGGEFYMDYTKATKVFASAWEARDITALQAGARALDDCKRECHDKYK